MSEQDPKGEKQEQDALQIVKDPKNYISGAEMQAREDARAGEEGGVSRRNLLKYSGAAAAALSVGASAVTGFKTGRSGDAYTGYGRTFQGEDMFFNREPFRAETAAMMEPVGEVTRPDWYDHLFRRLGAVGALIGSKQWTPDMGVENMPGTVGEYFRKYPEKLAYVLDSFERNVKQREYWDKTAYKRYALAGAYTRGYEHSMYNHSGSTVPEEPADVLKKTGVPQPPEVWDYRQVVKPEHKMHFKSPAHATKLIKAMTHLFGMSVVGICKFDERFMFKNVMRGMPDDGHDTWGDKVPEHWKSIIVFGVPMHWDGVASAIGYSTSFDAYFRSRVAAGLLEKFIMQLGYPARAQFPGYHYEIMITPYTLLSGLAEYSRAGLAMVPEIGANFRPAAVITDIEFEYDKPININMAAFCKKCKICAETCPSGAITFDDEPNTVIRGFKRWWLDEEKCYQQWASGQTVDGLGCRVCVGVCPFSRKNTWIHAISRELDARDPFGIVGTGLLAMQQNFFKYPKGEEFRATWDGGTEAVYHDPIWWERSEDFFTNVPKEWDYNGMH